jgi:anaerobic selenocysteine-containing dehydrogenase
MDEKNRGISRRHFLSGSAVGIASLTLGLRCLESESEPEEAAPATTPAATIRYGDYTDIWRERFKWDKVVKSSHARANCISACSWNVFVKGGIAWREEQNAIYAASEPGVPDFNPRGCQKGACNTDLMYEASRVSHPLRRVGERGSGRWKRVTWDAALTEIADAIIDASVASDTGAVVWDSGTTNVDFGPDTASEIRLFGELNSTQIDSWAGVGDMPMGAVQTWGMYNVEGTSDDWFKSDFIIVWVGNPAYTRIPEIHFMHEARYRGAKLVVIAPDYNATAVHADYWVNPRVGTDAALALGMAQVILEEDLHEAEYVREQTDLPILVREDTGRYLREADLEAGGADDVFYYWDDASDAIAKVPGCRGEGGASLSLGALEPSLSGARDLALAGGAVVKVRPLLDRLRAHLDASYRPDQVSETTGVGSGVIRRMARELAAANSSMIYSSWGACKHYHSDLMQRSKILLMALTGNQGKSGGGLRVASWWPVEGFEEMTFPGVEEPHRSARLAGDGGPDRADPSAAGFYSAHALPLRACRLLEDLGPQGLSGPRRAERDVGVHEGGRRQGLDPHPAPPRHGSEGLHLHGAESAAPLALAPDRQEEPLAEARHDRRRELQGQHHRPSFGSDPAHGRILRA